MTNPSPASPRPVPILLWILGLGAAGFAAGFVGPMVFAPEANQGPLVGILLSGPAGLLLGLVLGLACRLLRVPSAGQWWTLMFSCAAAVLVTLYFVMPEPALRGYGLDAQIQSCEPVAQVAEAAIQDWEQRVAATPWAHPSPEWREEARQMLLNDRGVVLNVIVLRKKRVLEARKPWNKGRMIASDWMASSEQKSYYAQYAGGSCSAYPVGSRSVHFSVYDVSILDRPGSSEWPPRQSAATFLNRETLDPVPEQYRDLVGE